MIAELILSYDAEQPEADTIINPRQQCISLKIWSFLQLSQKSKTS